VADDRILAVGSWEDYGDSSSASSFLGVEVGAEHSSHQRARSMPSEGMGDCLEKDHFLVKELKEQSTLALLVLLSDSFATPHIHPCEADCDVFR
jgi:hypothetical protein